MTNESTENKTAEELVAEEIINQAEEQVEVQLDAAADNISAEQEKINELELSLAAAKTTVADQKDSVIRAKAEVDNVRRRSAQDVEKARKFALEKFSGEMLVSGVKGVDPQDQPFNPEFHQAMSMQEVEGVAPNTVIAVMQKGYELNGRLLRPAMVMVSKAAPTVDTTA